MKNYTGYAGIAFLILNTACGNADTKDFTYDLSENHCGTGVHSFSSEKALCEGLKDDSLNQNCAYSMRANYFKENCSGNFYAKASPAPIQYPQPVSTPTTPPTPKPVPVATPSPVVSPTPFNMPVPFPSVQLDSIQTRVCIKYSEERYFLSMNGDEATDKAVSQCQKVKRSGDLECVKSLYPNYYASLSSSAAMDRAFSTCTTPDVMVRDQNLVSQITYDSTMSCFNFSYARNYLSLSSAEATDISMSQCRSLKTKEDIECIMELQPLYYRSLSGQKSMQRAVESCLTIANY